MGAIVSNLPVYEDKETAWDANAAIDRVKEWATDDNGDIDFSMYRKAFFWVDPDNSEIQGGYKLPFADVTGGKLEAVYKGVVAAMGALNGARGGVSIPDADKEAVYTQIKKYYKKFGEEAPEMKTLVKREVGERVDAIFNIDTSTVKDLGDGVFEATVTTSEVDRHMESIQTDGIETDQWMQNPVVLYGHDYQGLPIGKGLSLKSFKNKMTSRFQLAIKEYPFAATVADMIKGGYLNAVSIGGVVREWSDDYTKILRMEMVEFSVVPVPANPSALITSRSLQKATGKSVETIAKEYQDFVSRTIVDKAKKLEHNELQETIKNLEHLLTHLKAAASEVANEDEEQPKVKLFRLKRAAQELNTASVKTIRLIKAKEQ